MSETKENIKLLFPDNAGLAKTLGKQNLKLKSNKTPTKSYVGFNTAALRLFHDLRKKIIHEPSDTYTGLEQAT